MTDKRLNNTKELQNNYPKPSVSVDDAWKSMDNLLGPVVTPPTTSPNVSIGIKSVLLANLKTVIILSTSIIFLTVGILWWFLKPDELSTLSSKNEITSIQKDKFELKNMPKIESERKNSNQISIFTDSSVQNNSNHQSILEKDAIGLKEQLSNDILKEKKSLIDSKNTENAASNPTISEEKRGKSIEEKDLIFKEKELNTDHKKVFAKTDNVNVEHNNTEQKVSVNNNLSKTKSYSSSESTLFEKENKVISERKSPLAFTKNLPKNESIGKVFDKEKSVTEKQNIVSLTSKEEYSKNIYRPQTQKETVSKKEKQKKEDKFKVENNEIIIPSEQKQNVQTTDLYNTKVDVKKPQLYAINRNNTPIIFRTSLASKLSVLQPIPFNPTEKKKSIFQQKINWEHYNVGLQFNSPTFFQGVSNYLSKNNDANEKLKFLIPELWISRKIGNQNKYSIILALNLNQQFYTGSNLINRSQKRIDTTLVNDDLKLLKVEGLSTTLKFHHNLNSRWSYDVGLSFTKNNHASLQRNVYSASGSSVFVPTDSLVTISSSSEEWKYIKSNLWTGRFEINYSVKKFDLGVMVNVPIENISTLYDYRNQPINTHLFVKWRLFKK